MQPPPHAPAFLAAHGWAGAAIAPLAGDASFRRYFRITDRGRRAVLMDAPPDKEDSRPFLAVADELLRRGFSAPRLLAADLEAGLLLLEDFGDRLLGPVLAREPALEEPAYATAVALLAELHAAPPPAFVRPYDRAELAREALIFIEYYAAAAGLDLDPEPYLAAWDAAWGDAIAETAARPVLTLRDFHADNLMLLDRPGVAGLGLLDFQDALAGHPAYDLVSLLRDVRREVPQRLERAMLHRYMDVANVAERDGFEAAYEVIGAQRHAKILGVFVRLRDRDGRTGYVERLPREWAHLMRAFRHPALAPVKAWFDANVPAEKREPLCR